MTSRRSFIAVFALLGACAQQAPSQPAEPVIREALTRQAEAWNQHDAKAWVAAFSDDAEFINILGMSMQGRAEIEKRHEQIFRTIFSRSRVVVKTRKVRLLGTSAALAETDYELRDYDRLPPGIQPTDPDGTLRTRLKYVWEQRAEGWRIVSAQNTAILPPPSAPTGLTPPSVSARPAPTAPPN